MQKLLVVDDEEPVRALVERALHPEGYAVVGAGSGADALRIVGDQGRFDLYIIDVFMPGMRGDELAGRIRGIDGCAKVLYFTGQGELLESGTAASNEAFVDKPLSVAALREAVALMLFGRERPRA